MPPPIRNFAATVQFTPNYESYSLVPASYRFIIPSAAAWFYIASESKNMALKNIFKKPEPGALAVFENKRTLADPKLTINEVLLL